MRPFFFTALSILLGVGAARAQAPDPPSSLTRIVVLDTSGSMAGARLEEARGELLELGRQLPPSPAHPIIVVPFNQEVRRVHTFTTPDAYETFLRQVQAGGGTSIAKGIAAALQALAAYKDARHLCVLLYTDGEDGDLAGIQKQEAQLDALFGERHKRGLRQSVVFAKRWERANADLLARVVQRGHAQVIDAGELRIQPVTFTPLLSVTGVRWKKGLPRELEIDVAARVEAKGKSGGKLPLLQVTCRTPGARGDTAVLVRPGDGAPKTLTVLLPATPTMLAARATELEFDVALPSEGDAANRLLVPLLSADRVRVPVSLPANPVKTLLKAGLVQANPGYWVDPLLRRPAFPLTVRVDAASPPDVPWPEAVTFQFKPLAGNRIVGGDAFCTLKGPGQAVLPVTLDAAPHGPAFGPSAPYRVAITVVAKNVPPGMTFEPGEVSVSLEAPEPAPVVTRITTRTLSVGPAHWTDVVRGVAAFTAAVEFHVDGPLPERTVLTLHCPPGVRGLKSNPSTITTGRQTIQLALEADLPPAPAKRTFVLPVQPPPARGAVQISILAPIGLSAAGPPPVQLMLSQGGGAPSTLLATTFDKDVAAVLPVTPVLAGLTDAATADGLQARVASGPSLSLGGPSALRLNAPGDLSPAVPPDLATSFFIDTLVEEELTVLPHPPAAAVLGSKQRILLRVEVPFKRLLFALVAMASALLVLFFLFRMYTRFTSTHDA